MGGRARLASVVSAITIVCGMPPERPTPHVAGSWNVAPTDPLPIVRCDAKDHRRSLQVMRWGLVPFWVKDLKAGFANINAKTDGVWGFLRNPSCTKQLADSLEFISFAQCLAVCSKVADEVHGHEKALKRLASLQAMRPAPARRYPAPPPDVTRYKLRDIE